MRCVNALRLSATAPAEMQFSAADTQTGHVTVDMLKLLHNCIFTIIFKAWMQRKRASLHVIGQKCVSFEVIVFPTLFIFFDLLFMTQ